MSRSDLAAALAPTLEVASQRWADRTALRFHGESTTYERLWEQVALLAAAYQRLGIRRGDRVVCALRTCPEHLVALHAAWACGAVHVGAHHELTVSELSALVQRTDAAAVLFQARPEGADTTSSSKALPAFPPGTTCIVHGGSAEGAIPLAGLLQSASTPTADLAAPEDSTLLFLTSGTTGPPKAVRETLPALWAKVQFFAEALRPSATDVHLMYLPICHAFGLKLTLLALLSGGCVVLLERFSPADALRLAAAEQVTVLPGTPTHLTLLLDELDDKAGDPLASLRWVVTAAASLPRAIAEQVYRRLGAEIFSVYGCSEGFLTATSDRQEVLRGSVGHTVFRGPPGTPPAGDVVVVDRDGHTLLPTGETGEIAFRARCPVGYWDQPDAAGDGWYRTGDIGRLEPDGSLFVLGRCNQLVNRGGLKVSCGEVETALARHGSVADSAVVATPDPVLGEAICACVVPAGPVQPTLSELRGFLSQSLARHKLPDELCLLDGLPRTALGKLDRTTLLELVLHSGAPRQRLRPR